MLRVQDATVERAAAKRAYFARQVACARALHVGERVATRGAHRHGVRCANCDQRARSVCAACRSEAYCGAQCQQAHWQSTHESVCAHMADVRRSARAANYGMRASGDISVFAPGPQITLATVAKLETVNEVLELNLAVKGKQNLLMLTAATPWLYQWLNWSDQFLKDVARDTSALKKAGVARDVRLRVSEGEKASVTFLRDMLAENGLLAFADRQLGSVYNSLGGKFDTAGKQPHYVITIGKTGPATIDVLSFVPGTALPSTALTLPAVKFETKTFAQVAAEAAKKMGKKFEGKRPVRVTRPNQVITDKRS